MFNRAMKEVVEKITWPQKNLHYAFLQEGLSFRQLTYHHLMAREITTIQNCSGVERQG